MAERTAPLGTDEQADGHPAVTPDPWPANATFQADGMWIAGASAVALADRFSTPLVVFDHDDLTARFRAAELAFPKTFYAVKAFSAHAMLRMAVDEGLDLLAATGGEVEACVRAGVAPARVAFHGRNKSDDELALAVRARVGLVIADGLDELRRLDAFAAGGGHRAAVPAPREPRVARGHPRVDRDRSRVDGVRRSRGRCAGDGRGGGPVSRIFGS